MKTTDEVEIEVISTNENIINDNNDMIQVSRNDLNQLHEQRLLNGKNNNKNIVEIVRILGGIDAILSHYSSSSSHFVLNESNKANGKKEKFTFYFDVNDTFLRDIKKCDLFSQVIKNKYSSIIVMIILFILSFLFFLIPHSNIYLYLELILRPIFILYIILILLDLNKKACKLIIKSFDFLFKMSYAFGFVISWYIYWYNINSLTTGNDNYELWTIQYTNTHFCSILVIALFGFIDASQWKPWSKICIGVILSTITSLYALRLTFITYIDDSYNDNSVISIFPYYKISILANQTNSVRILSIWLWKQTIMSYYRGYKHNKCILLKVSPYLVFYDDTMNESTDFLISLCDKIGGIDSIISDKMAILNQKQINSIYRLLSISDDDDDENNDYALEEEIKIKTKIEPPSYYFKVNNSYLYFIFGDERANKIESFLWSNIAIFILLIFSVIFISLIIFIPNSIINIVFSILVNIYVIPWLFLSLLSCNICALKLVLKTFEFWFKMTTIFIWSSCHLIDSYYLNYDDNEINQKYLELHIFGNILIGISTFMALIVISLFDALNLKFVNKLITAILYAFTATIIVIYTQLSVLNDSNSKRILMISNGIHISIYAIRISSLRVMAIFGWKQVYLLAKKRNLKCIFIKYSPYIQWTNSLKDNLTKTVN